MITSHTLMPAQEAGIETRFVLARCPARTAHALQDLIRAFQTDFPAPTKRKHRLSKRVLRAVTAPMQPGAIRSTLAKLGITRLEETPASA